MKIQRVLKVKNARKLLIILAIFISSILLKVTLSDSFNVLNYLTVTIGLIIGTEIFILKDRYLNIKNNFFKSRFQRIYASEFISEVSDKTCFFIKKWKSIFKRNDKKNQDELLSEIFNISKPISWAVFKTMTNYYNFSKINNCSNDTSVVYDPTVTYREYFHSNLEIIADHPVKYMNTEFSHIEAYLLQYETSHPLKNLPISNE